MPGKFVIFVIFYLLQSRYGNIGSVKPPEIFSSLATPLPSPRPPHAISTHTTDMHVTYSPSSPLSLLTVKPLLGVAEEEVFSQYDVMTKRVSKRKVRKKIAKKTKSKSRRRDTNMRTRRTRRTRRRQVGGGFFDNDACVICHDHINGLKKNGDGAIERVPGEDPAVVFLQTTGIAREMPTTTKGFVFGKEKTYTAYHERCIAKWIEKSNTDPYTRAEIVRIKVPSTNAEFNKTPTYRHFKTFAEEDSHLAFGAIKKFTDDSYKLIVYEPADRGDLSISGVRIKSFHEIRDAIDHFYDKKPVFDLNKGYDKLLLKAINSPSDTNIWLEIAKNIVTNYNELEIDENEKINVGSITLEGGGIHFQNLNYKFEIPQIPPLAEGDDEDDRYWEWSYTVNENCAQLFSTIAQHMNWIVVYGGAA